MIGYTGNLAAALRQSIADLENARLEPFVDRMFPQGELRHPQAAVCRSQLLSRLKQHPTMVEQMKNDLSAVLESRQINRVSGMSASITL